MRSDSCAEMGSSSSTPAMVVPDLTVDQHVLVCSVCFLPLKPPIFQCGVGHVLCSPCSEKLKDAGKCHVCRVAMADGYQRCHAMEDVMNSIRAPCPHYGCDTRTAYHAREEHILECPHAPCHCPAGDACGFVGSGTTLLGHLAVAHSWPCTAVDPGVLFAVNLRDGFNFLTADHGGAMYLFLLNMASTPFGHAVSAVWIRGNSAPPTLNTTCHLDVSFGELDRHCKRGHYQRSQCQLECTSPSIGMPDPNASFQFFLPKYPGGSDEATVHVTAVISINSS